MPYRVEFKPFAKRLFKKLPHDIQQRISVKIDNLAVNPRPAGVEKNQGAEGLLRLRVGDYRIIYFVSDKVLVVLVITIGHRRDVYRR